MYNLYRIASLAAKDTINPEEEMDDDEENKAFEIDMLTAHAEETFIDNLKSLKTKRIKRKKKALDDKKSKKLEEIKFLKFTIHKNFIIFMNYYLF